MFMKTRTLLLFAVFIAPIFASAAGFYADPSMALSSMVPANVTSSPASAITSSDSRETTVFYLDKSYNPVTRLDRLKPLSEGMRAILAMYALQNAGGCGSFFGAHELKCVLTESLGLGNQCSDAHIHLVSTWFKNGMPNLAGTGEGAFQKAIKDGDLDAICARWPDNSGLQFIWEIIRVRQDNNHVHVEAIREVQANADGPDYEFKDVSEYSINLKDVTVLAHKEQPIKKMGEQ